MPIRPYRPGDRAQVLALVGDARAVDSPGHYVYVAEEGGEIIGVGLGAVPAAGEEAWLGPVLLEDVGRWDVLYGIVAGLVEQAIELGFDIGISETRSRRMVRQLERTFGLKGEPAGWEPSTGRPVEWSYRVHLPTFLEQLRSVM